MKNLLALNRISVVFCLFFTVLFYSESAFGQVLKVKKSASYSIAYDNKEATEHIKVETDIIELSSFDSVVTISQTNDIGMVCYKFWKSHLKDGDTLNLTFNQYAFCDSTITTIGTVGKEKTKASFDISCFNQSFPHYDDLPASASVTIESSEVAFQKNIISPVIFNSGSETKGSKTTYFKSNNTTKYVEYESVSRTN